MAPLTTTQILDRMRELDNQLASIGNEYGDVAATKVRAHHDREFAFASAYNASEGNSTDRRQAARASVGSMGRDADAGYAKIVADFELCSTRATLLESMLKKASDEDPRFRS